MDIMGEMGKTGWNNNKHLLNICRYNYRIDEGSMEESMGTLIFFLLLIGVVFAVFYNIGQKEKESAIVATKTVEFNRRNAQAIAILKVLRKKQAIHNNLTVEEREFMYILEQTERLVKEGEMLTRERAHVQANAALNFMTTTAWMEYMNERR